MVRHDISLTDLKAKITALVPTWMTRAGARTTAAVAAGGVGDGDGIWSEIKSIYMDLQGHKCMYCEKPMPRPSPQAVAEGKVEYDVEHFRPKNRVTKWPTTKVKQKRRIDYDNQLKEGETTGYVRLAFDPWNYGVSCKTCNSELKGDRFPILGATDATLTMRTALDTSERPCLLLPLGDDGPDPETWLEWKGPTVAPRATLDAQTKLRARAVVDFFELDTRSDLLLLRCMTISLLFPKLEEATQQTPAGQAAQQYVDAVTQKTRLFAACARAFVKLFAADRAAAERWRDRADEYIQSQDPSLLQ